MIGAWRQHVSSSVAFVLLLSHFVLHVRGVFVMTKRPNRKSVRYAPVPFECGGSRPGHQRRRKKSLLQTRCRARTYGNPQMNDRIGHELRELVSEAREGIAGGEHRLLVTRCDLQHCWFPVATQLGVRDQVLSDYGVVNESDKNVAKEFKEEVSALIAAIARQGDSRSLKEVEEQEDADAMAEAAWERMDRRPAALEPWDHCGAPVRLRGDRVYRIVSPRDVMGAPTIRSYPAVLYVSQVSVRTAELQEDLRLTRPSLVRWRLIAAVLLILIAALSWLWLR